MRTLFNDEFPVAYGQLYIDSRTDPDEGPDANLDECFKGQRSGLCGAAVPGHLFLQTGMHTGSVPLTVELHEEEPSLDVDGWEDIVETSFHPASRYTNLLEWGGRGWKLDLASDTYRVRYHCRGMDEARDGLRSEGEPVLDEYLLQFWPAPPERDRIVTETSHSAAYWHRFASELPPPPSSDDVVHDLGRSPLSGGGPSPADR